MLPRKPKVSVIILACNRARFPGEAIQSVLNQTFQDFELIVVDDDSTDEKTDVKQTSVPFLNSLS